jgi:hypothetical protein
MESFGWLDVFRALDWCESSFHRDISCCEPSHRSCFGSSVLGAGDLVDVITALHVVHCFGDDALRQFLSS